VRTLKHIAKVLAKPDSDSQIGKDLAKEIEDAFKKDACNLPHGKMVMVILLYEN
jgi:hypothetical protein